MMTDSKTAEGMIDMGERILEESQTKKNKSVQEINVGKIDKYGPLTGKVKYKNRNQRRRENFNPI